VMQEPRPNPYADARLHAGPLNKPN
jgi:hypothetical protein